MAELGEFDKTVFVPDKKPAVIPPPEREGLPMVPIKAPERETVKV